MSDPISNHAVAPLPYLPKLDGLRAICIALVLIEHFLWTGFGLGTVGVTIFFVISGYLITCILLSYAERFSIRAAALTFYWRRALRLFPIYYLCIAVTAALNIGGMRDSWLVNALYLANVKVGLDGSWNGSSHFWSLAVEEQFYLLWFVVVVAAPRRALLPLIVSAIIGAVLFRGLMYAAGATHFMDLSLPGVMDSLATGALLAYAVQVGRATGCRKAFVALRWPLLFLSAFLVVVALHLGYNELPTRLFLPCFMNVLALCAVAIAIDKKSDWRSDWLANRVLRHFGNISYGLYVYHYFLPEIVDAHMRFEWVHSYTGGRFLRFAVLSALSVTLAEISWAVIERPVLKLKDRVAVVEPGP